MTRYPRALITGAGRRLGLHLTRSLLAAGWEVIALTRQAEGELADLTDSKLQLKLCQPTDPVQLQQVIAELTATYDYLDLVVHNASVFEKDSAHQADLTGFYDLLYQVHMRVPMQLNEGLQGLLQSRQQSPRETANVIHVTDIYAENPNPEYTLYCSTKAALQNLMYSYAKRLAPAVRVNAIQPGPIKFLPEHSDAEQSQVLSETLLATEGGFEAVEQAVQALLNNEYLTGMTMRVDGGRAIT